MNAIAPPTLQRLSHIETVWTMVLDAHDASQPNGPSREARHEILARYGDAILRYLRGAFRDEVAAEETFQEFAIRLLQGDYRCANPEKGRFRGFLKVVLSRLVADHYRKQTRRRESPLETSCVIADDKDEQQRELDFQVVWRDDLLTKAWQRLADEETRTGKPWMTVLRLRVESPQLRSTELAERLGELIGAPVTATRLRVLLHRSREKFANHLIAAVSESLSTTDLDDVEQELAELQLLHYCQSMLAQRKSLLSAEPNPS